jgi:hypothetical protein
MEEGHQKSEIQSYMARFSRCTGENGNCRTVAIFGVDKSNI